MFLLTSLIKKPDYMTVEEFRTWWTDVKAPAVASTPGLRHFVICPVDAVTNRATRELDRPPPYDGVAMLWFDTEEDVRSMLATAAMHKDGDPGPAGDLQIVALAGTPIIKVGSVNLA